MKTRIVEALGLAVLCGLTVAPAHSLTLTSAENIFSFDLTSSDPPPPYLAITLDILFAEIVPGDFLRIAFYGSPVGSEVISVTDFPPEFFTDGIRFQAQTANPIFDPMLDGVYSIGISAPNRPLDVLEFTTCGLKTLPDVTRACVAVDVDPPIVAEPSSGALLGLALLALGVVRRRG